MFLGLLGSGRTFRRSLRRSQSILEEEEEDRGDAGLKQDAAAVLTDSTETEGECWTT